MTHWTVSLNPTSNKDITIGKNVFSASFMEINLKVIFHDLHRSFVLHKVVCVLFFYDRFGIFSK